MSYIEYWVMEQVTKQHYLSDFPHDTDGPQNAIMADKESLGDPAKEMAQYKYINTASESLNADLGAIHCILLQIV